MYTEVGGGKVIQKLFANKYSSSRRESPEPELSLSIDQTACLIVIPSEDAEVKRGYASHTSSPVLIVVLFL